MRLGTGFDVTTATGTVVLIASMIAVAVTAVAQVVRTDFPVS
jgi:hypothetical protein